MLAREEVSQCPGRPTVDILLFQMAAMEVTEERGEREELAETEVGVEMPGPTEEMLATEGRAGR